jgi:hypothetical protein
MSSIIVHYFRNSFNNRFVSYLFIYLFIIFSIIYIQRFVILSHCSEQTQGLGNY